jgi:hypothetical protein
MTEHEQKNLRAYCAFLLAEYGFQFSPTDPVLPVLYVIHREMLLSNKKNQAIASAIETASSRINPKVYQFNHTGEAWKFQIGIALKWILYTLPVLVLLGITTWYWSIASDINKARAIIDAAGDIGKLMQDVKKDDNGVYFIEFTAAKGDSIRSFKEFHKINTKTVRVYLGKQ